MINKHIKNKIILISILTTWLVLFEILAIIYGYDALQINSVDWLFKKIEIVFNVTIWIYLILLLVFVFKFKKYLLTKKIMSIKEKIIYGICIINFVFMIIIILISTILITLWKILWIVTLKPDYIKELTKLILNCNRTIFFFSSVLTLLSIYQITFYCILIHNERKQFLMTKQQSKSDN